MESHSSARHEREKGRLCQFSLLRWEQLLLNPETGENSTSAYKKEKYTATSIAHQRIQHLLSTKPPAKMLDQTFTFIRDSLDAFLRSRLDAHESLVITNQLADTNGNSLTENTNKVVITLVNLEQETAKRSIEASRRSSAIPERNTIPASVFSLHILITANFDSYQESLKLLSEVVKFLQRQPRIDASNYPSLPKSIAHLDLQYENLNYSEIHQLWDSMGMNYKPSAICKIQVQESSANEKTKKTSNVSTKAATSNPVQ